MNWLGLLKRPVDLAGELTKKPNIRNFSGKVKPDETGGLSDPSMKEDSFLPERSYFSVKIVEMRLAEAGRYVSEFVPMCSCFLRYTYGRSERTLPFVLGTETISAGLGNDIPKDVGRHIQFNNVYIVRNVPVKADNLFIYCALCRFKDPGFARGLLNLLSDAAGVVGGTAVGAIAKTGVDLTNRLGTLLGADGVDTRFGMLNGNALDTSGYRVFAGVSSTDLQADELAMRGGQLVRRQPDQSEVTIDDIDYLVIGLEHRATLVEDSFGQVSILPFHIRWEEVRKKLLAEDKDGAKEALKGLLIEVASSPDVTEADRLALIAAYREAFSKWAAVGSTTEPLMSLTPNYLAKASPSVNVLLNATRRSILKSDREGRKADRTSLVAYDLSVCIL